MYPLVNSTISTLTSHCPCKVHFGEGDPLYAEETEIHSMSYPRLHVEATIKDESD